MIRSAHTSLTNIIQVKALPAETVTLYCTERGSHCVLSRQRPHLYHDSDLHNSPSTTAGRSLSASLSFSLILLYFPSTFVHVESQKIVRNSRVNFSSSFLTTLLGIEHRKFQFQISRISWSRQTNK